MNLKILNSHLHKWLLILVAALIVSSQTLLAQATFKVNGSALAAGNNCFTITPNEPNKIGSVWNNSPISLKASFDFTFQVNMGNKADGGDGMAFVLQTAGTSAIGSGGLGYEGLNPSLAIEFDTYSNTPLNSPTGYNDPAFDHIAIHKNGSSTTNGLVAGGVQASATTTNIKDGNWHTTRIVWNEPAKLLSVYFDGILRTTYNNNIASILGSTRDVYWGFTGRTGNSQNLQQVCMGIAMQPAAALSFDGVDDFIDGTNNFAIGTSDLTVETWVKFNSFSSAGMIISKEREGVVADQFRLYNRADGKMEFAMAGSGVSSQLLTGTSVIPLNTWTHIAIVRQGTVCKLFVNGVLDATITTSTILNHSNILNWRFGGRYNQSTNTSTDLPFSGSLDEVRIWNRALCQGEIQNNRNSQLNLPQIGLVTYYKLNQGFVGVNNSTTNKAIDEVTNTFNGNLTNFALSGTSSNWVEGNVTGTAQTFIAPTATASNNGPLFEGSAINLTSTGSGTFSWTGPNGFTSNQQNPSIASATLAMGGEYNVTVTNNGCTASASTQVVVYPAVVTKDITVFLNSSGTASIVAADVYGGSTTTLNMSVTKNSFSCSDINSSPIAVTLTLSDNGGVSSGKVAYVTVRDTIKPIVPVLSTVTGECSATVTPPITTDNCSGNITGTSSSPLTYNAQGTYNILWTFNDGNGNTSTATQTIIVKDVTAPFVPVLPNITGQCSATVSAPTTTDNCKGTITGATSDSVEYTTQGTRTITWAFNDGNGNTSTATQTIIVKDITKPVVPTLIDVTGQCSATVSAPTTTDNCKGTVTGTTSDSVEYSTQGTRTITWTFDDGNGNTSTATQTVIVKDITKPVVPTLIDVTGQCSATVSAPTTTDNCKGTITGATSDSVEYSTQGTRTITWTFDDGNGNTSTATQTVIVKDITAPVVPVLATVTGECSATVSTPTTTDNCKGTVTATTSDSVEYSSQGTRTITWTFNDGNGNISTATQTVIVNDVTNPMITAPPNIIVNTDAGLATANITIGVPATSDNCAVASVTNNHPSSVFPIGTTTVIWTVTDINNNTSTATQTVTVNDYEKPIIICIAPIVKSNDVDRCGAIVNFALPFANDNASTTTTLISAGCSDKLIDFDLPLSNNVSSINFITSGAYADIAHGHGENNTITIQLFNGSTWDVVKTLQTGNSDYHFGGTSISFPLIAEVSKIRFTSSDSVHCAFHFYDLTVKLNSSIITQTSGLPSGSLFPTGTTTNTFSATDAFGNNATCSFTVTVNDEQKPSIVGTPANITKQTDAGSCGANVSWSLLTATDNCDEVKLTSSHQSGAFFPVGKTIVDITAKDTFNNVSVSSFTITVIDNQKPSISAPANITVSTDLGKSFATINNGLPVVSDNCAIDFVVSDHPSNIYPIGTTLVKWTVKDIHGNTNTAIQTIVVSDNEKPVITGMPLPIIQTNDAGICGALLLWIHPKVTDNSNMVSLVSSHQPGATFNIGVTIVTYTATDGSGNVTTSSFSITVRDNEAPTVITKPKTIILDNGTATINYSDIDNGSTDNCGISTRTVSKTSFNCTNIGTNIVTLTVTDINGNTSNSTALVTVEGAIPVSNIYPVPSNTINTGGVPSNIYLGYGPQSVTLNQTNSGGSSFTYSWSATGATGGLLMLSCSTCATPVFAPTAPGTYTFTCTTTNEFGCSTVSSITICVRDIRVPGTDGSQIYICDYSSNKQPQTVAMLVTSVETYLARNPEDKLGSCDMQDCSDGMITSPTPTIVVEATSKDKKENTDDGLTVKVSPNPSSTRFTLIINSPNISTVSIRIMNELGQVSEAITNASLGVPVYVGSKLMPGSYYAEVIQNKERKIVKLIKVNH